MYSIESLYNDFEEGKNPYIINGTFGKYDDETGEELFSCPFTHNINTKETILIKNQFITDNDFSDLDSRYDELIGLLELSTDVSDIESNLDHLSFIDLQTLKDSTDDSDLKDLIIPDTESFSILIHGAIRFDFDCLDTDSLKNCQVQYHVFPSDVYYVNDDFCIASDDDMAEMAKELMRYLMEDYVWFKVCYVEARYDDDDEQSFWLECGDWNYPMDECMRHESGNFHGSIGISNCCGYGVILSSCGECAMVICQ